jgi:hypothetical protein
MRRRQVHLKYRGRRNKRAGSRMLQRLNLMVATGRATIVRYGGRRAYFIHPTHTEDIGPVDFSGLHPEALAR